MTELPCETDLFLAGLGELEDLFTTLGTRLAGLFWEIGHDGLFLKPETELAGLLLLSEIIFTGLL